MRVEWENYKDYGDGDCANWCEGKFFLNDGREFEVTITDHTRPGQQKEDEHYRRQVTHAYEISGMPYYRSAKAFYEVGFDSHPGLNSVGLDINPGYEDGTSIHAYKGDVPKHSIKEVEAMVEQAFVKSFQFDYEGELTKYKAELDKKQIVMDEVNAWQKQRKEEKNGIQYSS